MGPETPAAQEKGGTAMAATMIRAFDDPAATLDQVGGKGANLARMARAGFPVPGGFLVTTTGYRAFVAANDLQAAILETVRGIDPANPQALEAASESIRARFAAGQMPADLAAAIAAAYTERGAPPVAVRSSATAEDLPDLSFAGQQDTYLNILGTEALLDAVVRCWASLWTARAIGYRARNGIAPDDVALSVVVQEMVQSEASGVLFTANPLTGRRDEVVIDATLGLGEALVSGQVEPDHYVVDGASGQITAKTLGAKALAIVGEAGGGTRTVTGDGASAGQQALPDPAIRDLAQLGRRVAAHYGTPQDIEWGWAGEKLYLLQARPITSLYPLPPRADEDDDLRVYFSFASIQGVLDPYTPLGQDAISQMFSSMGRIFGFHATIESQTIIKVAGERLFLDITPIVRSPLGRIFISRAGQFMDPAAAAALAPLLDEPGLARHSGPPPPSSVRHFMQGLSRLLPGAVLNMLRPAARYRYMRRSAERALAELEAQSAAASTPQEAVAFFADSLGQADRILRPFVMPGLLSGMLSFVAVQRLAAEVPGGPELAREITRGLPHNVTTEMGLLLWQTARSIQTDSGAAARFRAESADDLAAAYKAGSLPVPVQQAIAGFLRRYGMRGVGEIDFGRPRWSENIAQVMQMLKSYVQIESPDQAPDVQFRREAAAAQVAIRDLIAAARATEGGARKARVIRFLARRMRTFVGMRESPKFTIIRLFGMARAALLRAGAAWVSEGVLDAPEDVVYLHLRELQALAAGDRRDWRAVIAERRALMQRESARRLLPRLLLSDGRAFYEGLGAGQGDGATLIGSPVSAGVVEGTVHVVLDPQGVHLAHGEILVCPATDPGWTPLFLAAGGLVMEIGGMMTHGSVVAREYGIPAVVGVHEATQRLHTGQRIRVDGTTGEIHILDEAEAETEPESAPSAEPVSAVA
jgi:pyruvate,water dikinase